MSDRNRHPRRSKKVNLNKWRTVAVSAPMYAALKRVADENDRSISKQVAHILKKFFESEGQIID